MTKKTPPKAPPKPPINRIDLLTKSRALIGEYIQLNFEDLMALRNGPIIIQTVAKNLNLMEDPVMVELVTSVWQEQVLREKVRREARESLKKDIQKPVRSEPITKQVGPTVEELQKEIERGQLEQVELIKSFQQAIMDLTEELTKPRKSLWACLKERFRRQK